MSVPNETDSFSFINKIFVSEEATWQVSTDLQGREPVPTKTVPLNVGDNAFYILVTSGNGKNISLYTVTLRRRPIYTVKFETNGGTDVEDQRIEEDSFVIAPTSTRVGYNLVLWNYDFTHLSGNDTTQLTIIKEEPVVAYYLTKPFNFGTSMYEKTIWGFTVINDTGLGSDTGLSYVSNREERDIQSQISSNGIDLNEYNYDHFSFANDNLPHMYTRYKVISRVSFIRFAFKNNESTNMVLTELTLLYSVSRLTRGIK